MPKFFLPFLFLTLLLSTSCRMPESAIMELPAHTTIHVKKPYQEVSTCIMDGLKPLNKDYSERINGLDLVSQVRIYKKPLAEGNGDFIYDLKYAGFNQFRSWGLVVKQDSKESKETNISIKSRISLWGTPAVTQEYFQKFIQQCLAN